MAEEFVFVLPPHLTIEARRRVQARRAFEQEVLALLGELLGCEPPPVDTAREEHRAPGTWDWHIVRAWEAAGRAIRAIARPIEHAGTHYGEDIEFELIEAPPYRIAAFASLDVRIGGSLRVTVAGGNPAELARVRAAFGRQLEALLAALT